MRELQECQAEVFRRSEKRIRARRQRTIRMLLACIPLVLCIAVASMYTLPALLGTGTKTTGAADPAGRPTEAFYNSSGKDEGVPESTRCPVSKIEVQGTGVFLFHMEPQELSQIFRQLRVCMDDITNDREETTQAGSGSTPSYTIILTMEDGSTEEFWLAGNTLLDRSTGRTGILSQEQLTELERLLGIAR